MFLFFCEAVDGEGGEDEWQERGEDKEEDISEIQHPTRYTIIMLLQEDPIRHKTKQGSKNKADDLTLAPRGGKDS